MVSTPRLAARAFGHGRAITGVGCRSSLSAMNYGAGSLMVNSTIGLKIIEADVQVDQPGNSQRGRQIRRKLMYTIAVCIVLTTIVALFAGVMFAATVIGVIVSYGVKRTSSALRAACRGWIPAMLSEARLLPGLAPRRAR